jgi:ferric-dicitrate binding protein FerR (iron transport regulator)
VLGTAFNVKNYPADETMETALMHGSIEVSMTDRPAEKIVLTPNEKLIIRKDQQSSTAIKPGEIALPKVILNNISITPEKLVVETAWMQNKIAFTNQSLLYISHILERKFNVTFLFKQEVIKAYSYTGIFQNESLEKILELLSTSQKFEYTIKGGQVTISK